MCESEHDRSSQTQFTAAHLHPQHLSEASGICHDLYQLNTRQESCDSSTDDLSRSVMLRLLSDTGRYQACTSENSPSSEGMTARLPSHDQHLRNSRIWTNDHYASLTRICALQMHRSMCSESRKYLFLIRLQRLPASILESYLHESNLKH